MLPLRVGGAATPEGGQGASLQVLDAPIQGAGIIKVTAGSLTGVIFRAPVTTLTPRNRQGRQRGPHFRGAEISILNKLTDLLDPHVFSVQIVGFEDNLR